MIGEIKKQLAIKSRNGRKKEYVKRRDALMQSYVNKYGVYMGIENAERYEQEKKALYNEVMGE